MSESAEITSRDMDTVVKMIATLTGLPTETATNYLELYYHVRRSCESGKTADRFTVHLQTPEELKEPSPVEKAAAFKQEIRDRMMAALSGSLVGTKKLAYLAGIEERQVLAIMESKKQSVSVYRLIERALDHLEERSEQNGKDRDPDRHGDG